MTFTKSQYKQILFIFALMMIIPTVHCCDTYIDTMGCQFQVRSKNSSSCTALDLLYCQWRVCDYYVKNKNNQTSCGHYSTRKSASWGICMSQCCRGSDGPQTYETLSKCYEDNKKIAIIIGSVIGGIIGLALLIFLICLARQCIARFFGAIFQCIGGCCKAIADFFRNCFRCFSKQEKKEVSEGQIYIVSDPILPKSEQLQMAKIQWIDKEQQIYLEQPCVMCQQNTTTVRLQCNHAYHQQCINEWVAQKSDCFLCNKQITKMIIYCKECMKKKKQISLQMIRDKTNPIIQFCQNCS